MNFINQIFYKIQSLEKYRFFCLSILFLFSVICAFQFLYSTVFWIALAFTSALFVWRKAYLSLLIFAFGFFYALIHIFFVHEPLLKEPIRNVEIQGMISKKSTNREIPSIILSDVNFTHAIEQKTQFENIKVFLNKSDLLDHYEVGQKAKFFAHLYPFKTFKITDKYDVSFWSYFNDVQAKAYAQSKGFIISTKKDEQSSIENLRQNIGQNITASKINQFGLAKALLIGDRQDVPKTTIQSIREAGLAHLLAISGLHIAMVAGLFFVVLRKALALSPHLALHYPLKKWAAILAWIAAIGYFLISGQTLPTIRAILMASLVFLAILIDRSVITLRSVALAAIFILLLSPEQVFSVSFQLSFAAVLALVSYYHFHSERFIAETRLQKIWHGFVGIAISSALASFVTLPIVLYHFGAVALYGVLGNLVAIPLMSFFVMPLLVLSLLSMPFGFEGIFLPLADIFLNFFVTWADWVANLPYSKFESYISVGQAFTIVAFCTSVIFTKLKWKLVSLVAIALFFYNLSSNEEPRLTLQLSPTKFYAIKGQDRYALLQPKYYRHAKQSFEHQDFQCDHHMCHYKDLLVLFKKSKFKPELCQYEYIVSPNSKTNPCENEKIFFGKSAFQQQGRILITIHENDEIDIQTESQLKGPYPWVNLGKK